MDDIYKKLSLEELLRDYAGESGAWYWIGMAHWERGEHQNAARWLERTRNDSGDHGWQGKATLNLGDFVLEVSRSQTRGLEFV